MYSHYEDEVNKKRKLRAPPVRAYGTRHAAAEEALNDLETESVSNKRRRSAGDDEGNTFEAEPLSQQLFKAAYIPAYYMPVGKTVVGHRYLEYLWQHISKQSVPPE